jgi:hypothetical protein
MAIERPHQVWAADITYVPLPGGWAYLLAILEWFTRYVLAWALSPTRESLLGVRVWQEAVAVAGRAPQIMNTDQGAEFCSDEWVGVVQESGALVSQNGRGRALDNVMVERLWRTVKWDHLYLHDYSSVRAARAGLGEFFPYYNERRWFACPQSPEMRRTATHQAFHSDPGFELPIATAYPLKVAYKSVNHWGFIRMKAATISTITRSSISALLALWIVGCSPSPESARLKRELAESQQELAEMRRERDELKERSATAASDAKRLRAELATLQREMGAAQATKPSNTTVEQPSSPQLTKPIVFSDRLGAIQVTILSILDGEAGVAAERLWKHKVESEAKRGKRVVYYEIMVKNVEYSQEFNVDHHAFKLEDEQGNTYSCEQTQDYVTGRIHRGKTTRGGISFAIFQDAKPRRLVYRTGLQNNGVSLEASVLLP